MVEIWVIVLKFCGFSGCAEVERGTWLTGADAGLWLARGCWVAAGVHARAARLAAVKNMKNGGQERGLNNYKIVLQRQTKDPWL